jgi:hypothetical protein
MPDPVPWACALLLLVAANAVPWLLGHALGERFAAPIDLGFTLKDGQRLLGAHKTWRGLVAGMLGCGIAAMLCGNAFALGLAFGGLSLAGDAVSSAMKRRLRLTAGAQLPLFDQLLEALLPLVVLRAPLGLSWVDVALTAAMFTAGDLALTGRRRRR